MFTGRAGVCYLIATVCCSALAVNCVKTRDFVELEGWLSANVGQTDDVRADFGLAKAKIEREEIIDESSENFGAKKALKYLIELNLINEQLVGQNECGTRPLGLVRLIALILGKRPNLAGVKRLVASCMDQVARVCLPKLMDSFKPMEKSVKAFDRTLKLFQRPEGINLEQYLLSGRQVDGKELGQMLYNLRETIGYKLRMLHINYYLEVAAPCDEHSKLVEHLMLDLRDILSLQRAINVEQFISQQSDTFKDALYIYAVCKGAKRTRMDDIEVGFGRALIGNMGKFFKG